ncbi:hypothetical protein [Maricaulis maris]|jgi:hypothetical protein|uniref:hypothetical protein n=1 Tax=Maricaulis maris TaxID=74318 RepID=UPI0026F06651|nr:hypothetical protein [Maricaulis maris]
MMLLQSMRGVLTGLALVGLSAAMAAAQSSAVDPEAPLAADRLPASTSNWSAVLIDEAGRTRTVHGRADGARSLGAGPEGIEALYRATEAQIYEREAENLDYAVVEPAPRRPIYLDREYLRYLDVRVTSVSAETWRGEPVERLALDSRHDATPEALSGEVLITGDGIVVAAELGGTHAPEGQDIWVDWSAAYQLSDLERGVDHDPALFEWPESVAHMNAPG